MRDEYDHCEPDYSAPVLSHIQHMGVYTQVYNFGELSAHIAPILSITQV